MRTVIWIILWAVSIFLCTSASQYRLDGNIVPTFYRLNISVTKKQKCYLGVIQIDLKVKQPSTYVSLHYDADSVHVKSVILNDDVECKVNNYDGATKIAKIQCTEQIATGSVLQIKFKGLFYQMYKMGFYITSFIRENKPYSLLNTYFSRGYAKNAFPCFDEPSFKANFKLVMRYTKDYVAVSNTLVIDTEVISAAFKETIFTPTLKISPHSVAFSLVPMKLFSESDTNVDGYNLRIYTKLGEAHNTRTIQDYSVKVIAKMGAWTSTSYTEMGYTQLNTIVVPALEYISQEYWGLIDYSNDDLLDDPHTTSASKVNSIVRYIGRAIATQWFGSYVTPHWWSDAWLNDGLAEYFGYHIFSKNLESDEDEFELNNQFVGTCLNGEAFIEDSQPGSLPISHSERAINVRRDIDSVFENWYFAKGASIIRMMSYILGESQFQDGIKLYLTKRKYQTVNTGMLLEDLAEGAKQDKEDFVTKMRPWINWGGFPLVTATVNEDASEIVLTQKPYNRQSTIRWWIPISYTTSSEKNFTFKCSSWIEPTRSLKISFNNDAWIIFNLQVVGFYRVDYDDTLWNKIITALKGEDMLNIHPLNRAQLIYDQFELASIGIGSFKRAFELADYLINEIDYYPWRAACSMFSRLWDSISPENQLLLKDRLTFYMAKAISSTESSEGSGNKHIERLKKIMLQEWACFLGNEVCINYAKEEFEKFISSESLSDYDRRDIVFCYGLKNSNNASEHAKFLLEIYKRTNSRTEETAILKSFSCISDKTELESVLMTLLENKLIAVDQLALVTFEALMENDDSGFDFIIEFMQSKAATIRKCIRPQVFLDIRNKLLQKLVTAEQFEKFKKIRDNNKILLDWPPTLEKEFSMKLGWINTYGPIIGTLLENRNEV